MLETRCCHRASCFLTASSVSKAQRLCNTHRSRPRVRIREESHGETSVQYANTGRDSRSVVLHLWQTETTVRLVDRSIVAWVRPQSEYAIGASRVNLDENYQVVRETWRCRTLLAGSYESIDVCVLKFGLLQCRENLLSLFSPNFSPLGSCLDRNSFGHFNNSRIVSS